MPASTLALGQSSYELLDIDTGSTAENVSVSKRGASALIRSNEPGNAPIENFGIGFKSDNISDSVTNDNINILGNLNNFTANTGSGRDALNINGNLNDVQLILDDQDSGKEQFNDRLYIRGDVKSSDSNNSNFRNGIWTGGGNDTVRISGQVTDTNVHLGDGNDSLLVDGSSERFYVNGEQGRDYIELRDPANDAIIQAGDDNDTVVLRGNLFGTGNSEISKSDYRTAAVDLGAGNDSLVLGGGSENAQINTGSGSDTVRLFGFVGSTNLYLDGSSQSENDGSDLLIISDGTIFDNISLSSSSNGTDGDTMVVGARSNFYNSEFLLGAGNDSLLFGSDFFDLDSTIDLGSGSDTVIFSSASFDGTVIDLGSDNQADLIRFDSLEDYNSDFSKITIKGAGEGDILFIGHDELHYNSDYDTFMSIDSDDNLISK